MKTKKSASIFGFGRFGQLWALLIGDEFEVFIYDPDLKKQQLAKELGYGSGSVEQLLQKDVVFYAVPITAFEQILTSHLTVLSPNSLPLFVDLLSVKLLPLDVFRRILRSGAGALLLHPLFGPDAVQAMGGVRGLPIVLDGFRLSESEIESWIVRFSSMGMLVSRMSADEHDQLAARSQGLTHYLGRIVGMMNIQPTPIDTVGTKKLLEIKDQVWNDSWELFTSLQTANPYTRQMRLALDAAQRELFGALLPNRVFSDRLVVGIQGGKGSFNEAAALAYLKENAVDKYELVYLFTSERVLKSLHEGEIDRGQFAIHNSVGGIVQESIFAMSRYHFHIVKEFSINITHSLMIHPKASLTDIKVIMAHPQVFQQCGIKLRERFSHLSQQSGEGDSIDSARAAELLINSCNPNEYAVMGNPAIAEIYGLKKVADNLQDLQTNHTSFLWVERP